MSKQASLGEISTPESSDKGSENSGDDWTSEKIGDIFEGIKSGGTPKRGKDKYWEDGKIPFVKIEDLNRQQGDGISDAKEYTTQQAIEDGKTRVYDPGTILLTIYGTLGETGIVTEPVSTNQGIIGLWDPKDTNVQFARYALDFEQDRLASKKRETTQANISKNILKLHEIPHPPEDEQRRIASVLYNVDQAIQKTEEIIEQTKRVKKGVMQDLLTGEVRTKNKPIEEADPARISFDQEKSDEKSSDNRKWRDQVGEIQEMDESPVEDRELVKLGEVMTLEYGENLTEDDRNEGEVPVYGSNGPVDKHDEAYVEKEGIVIGRRGTIGGAVYSESAFWPIDTTYYITEDETELNLKFLYYLINSLQLDRFNAASIIPGLNRNDVYGLKALVPDEETQAEIVEQLEAMDDLIEKKETEKEQLQRLKKGLMQDLLTGNVRTKNKDIEVPLEVEAYG